MMGSQGAVDDVGVMEAGLALTPAARGTSNNPRHSCAGSNPVVLASIGVLGPCFRRDDERKERGLAGTPAARGTSNNPRHSCACRNPATSSLREHKATGYLPAQG
jgi:hypothetical protein